MQVLNKINMNFEKHFFVVGLNKSILHGNRGHFFDK